MTALSVSGACKSYAADAGTTELGGQVVDGGRSRGRVPPERRHRAVADYVAVPRDGVITKAGPPREVYTAPTDPWTASFLGTANLLPGVLQNQGVRTALGWHEMRAGGQLPDGGGEVTVLIRPEQITLAPFPRSAEGITGKVTEARYHGHYALIAVDVEDAGVLQVRMLGAVAPAPGDEVCLTVTGQVTAWREGSF